MIYLRVVRRIDECHQLAFAKLTKLRKTGIAGQFCLVATAKLSKSLRLVVEPDPQFRARGNILHPNGEVRLCFRDAAWPQSINKDARAVLRTCRLIDAFDLECHLEVSG